MQLNDTHPVHSGITAPQTDTLATGTRRSFYSAFGKRLADLILVTAGSVFVGPLILILALFVMMDGGRPFYVQERVGRKGRVFKMLKLRSMVVGADQRLAQYLEENKDAAEEWARTQKLKHDPRITRVGRFIRRTSLDELPQVWNVLIGDMSLVGPRPIMVDQQDLYNGSAYYELRPGITGPWQVSARNASSFAERAVYDSSYRNQLCFGVDLGLLVKTVRIVLRGTGY